MISFFVLFAIPSVVYMQLTVFKPEALRNIFAPNGTIEYSLGNFGFIPYGQSISAILTLADSLDGCQLKAKSEMDKDEHLLQQPYGVLVTRGNCTFVQKAFQAERAGFSFIIIADTKDENIAEIQMIDTNHTQQVNIPTALISFQDGEKLKNFMNTSKEETYVNLKFAEPNKTEIVSYQYWLSSLDQESYLFIDQFKQFHKELSKNLTFTPHYAMWYSYYCKEHDWNVKVSQCLSGGRYCAFDPDYEGPFEGKDVVWQNLRQICIFKTYPDQWWDFMSSFGSNCLLLQNVSYSTLSLETCVDSILVEMKINRMNITKCMFESFAKGPEADIDLDDSIILRDERQEQLFMGVQSYPALIVNGQQYRGALSLPVKENMTTTFDTAHYGPLQFLCQSFQEDALPKYCKERLQLYIDENGNLKEKVSDSSITGLVWFFTLLIIIVLMLIILYCYRRQMRKAMQQQMQLQVNMAISQYFTLNDNDKITVK